MRDLEGVKLHAEEARILRDAADARLFSEDDVEMRMADADVVLLRLELSERLTNDGVEGLRRKLAAVIPAPQQLAA